MDNAPGFTLAVEFEHEQYRDGHTVDVAVTVGTTDADTGAGPASTRRAPTSAGFAEVVLVDRSGSMGTLSKHHLATRAAAAAVDLLQDGVLFAVVGGDTAAWMIYPSRSELAVADRKTRAAARAKLERLAPGTGGTIIGAWLDQARELLGPHRDRVRHATLLTDGKNQHQRNSARTMDDVLADCEGVFTCDARGIGADWEPDELRRIADRLQGTADAVPELADLEHALADLVRGAARRKVAQAALRVRCPPQVSVTVLEETYPILRDLVPHATPVPGTPAVDYPTGPWSIEERSYVLTLGVQRDPDAAVGSERLASIEIVAGTPGSPDARATTAALPVDVLWTDILSPGTVLDPFLRRHREEKQQRALRQRGGLLYERGDEDGALRAWGEAARLATALSNEDALSRLRLVVSIDDGPAGRIRMLKGLSRQYVFNVMMGDYTSTITRTGAQPGSPSGEPPAPPRIPAKPPKPDGRGPTCPKCGRIASPGSRFCENLDCDHDFTAPEPQ